MGEILEELKQKRDRLVMLKQQITNFNMTDLNNRIAKLNTIITVVEQAGG